MSDPLVANFDHVRLGILLSSQITGKNLITLSKLNSCSRRRLRTKRSYFSKVLKNASFPELNTVGVTCPGFESRCLQSFSGLDSILNNGISQKGMNAYQINDLGLRFAYQSALEISDFKHIKISNNFFFQYFLQIFY